MIIHKLIVHVLDKNSDVPILNDFEGKITQEVDGFFQKVIKRAAKDDDLRKAVFKEYHDNIIKNCCEQIIYNEDTFLDNSKEIASYLFEIMRINSELESCDLAICLYTNKDEKNVAILKLDYKKLYNHSIKFVEDKFNINFKPNEIGIVETQKPKQCALIGISGINDEWHMKVLDKISEKEGIETKFTTQFLNIEKILDDKYMTKSFKRSADNWITNAIRDDVKYAEAVRSGLYYSLKEKSDIDIKEFADTYLKDEDKKESFVELMEEKEIESFNIDKDWVEKKVKKRRIKTDNGFSIEGNITTFEDPMRYSIRNNENGTVDIIVKNVSFYEEK